MAYVFQNNEEDAHKYYYTTDPYRQTHMYTPPARPSLTRQSYAHGQKRAKVLLFFETTKFYAKYFILYIDLFAH